MTHTAMTDCTCDPDSRALCSACLAIIGATLFVVENADGPRAPYDVDAAQKAVSVLTTSMKGRNVHTTGDLLRTIHCGQLS